MTDFVFGYSGINHNPYRDVFTIRKPEKQVSVDDILIRWQEAGLIKRKEVDKNGTV